MIQGGIVNTNKPPIIGEFSSNGVANDLKHVKGVISMARTNVFNSATSQFFIVHKDSPHLNGEYAGFGGLISGFDVLDKIAEVKTGYGDAPLKEVVITKITVDLRGYEVS
ncbi:MAG TPA: peptidylprolyl isomerase [Acholeplasmataceae bacterium]|nr:peptidylprolyl isomerase [Acholeplasmataceae bacterium]